MRGSSEYVMARHAARNDASLPAWNVAMNTSSLTELAQGIQCVGPCDG